MILTTERLCRNGYSPTEAQTALYKAARDAVSSGYHVTRVFTLNTDEKQRTTKTINEVHIS